MGPQVTDSAIYVSLWAEDMRIVAPKEGRDSGPTGWASAVGPTTRRREGGVDALHAPKDSMSHPYHTWASARIFVGSGAQLRGCPETSRRPPNSTLIFAHSTRFRGGVWHRSSKAARCEDLQVEEPVACWDCSSFHFHATLARVLRPTLIGH